MKFKLTLIFVLLFLVCTQSFAFWDGEREGFILGFGIGVGYDSYTGIQYDSISSKKKDNSSIAFAASPRIGYAFNNQMAIMYSRHPLSYTVESDDGNDVTITSCTEALQFFYYFKNSAPSLYLGAGAGIAYFFDEKTFNEPAMNYSANSLKGPAIYGIIGFEAIKHVNTEFAIHFRAPQKGAKEMGVSLMIGVLGY